MSADKQTRLRRGVGRNPSTPTGYEPEVRGVVLAIVLIPRFGAWSHFETFHHH